VADESEINVLFPLFVCNQLAGTLLAREIRGSGLTTSEFGVLSAIGVWGPLSPTDLAQRVGMPATTLSDYVSRFTSRRLVKRTRHPADGRSYLLELTAEGRRRHRQAGGGLLRALDEIAGALEQPAAQVRASLLELEAALRRSITPRS